MPGRFNPFNIPEEEGEPGGTRRGQFQSFSGGSGTPAIIEEFLRATGMIGDGDEVEFVGIAVGVTQGTVPGGWSPGDPLPHTSRTFDDPPLAYTQEEWRDKLIDAVRHAEDEDEFSFSVKASLGKDMVASHGVPVDTAIDGCGEFAAFVWAEYADAVRE